MSDIETTLKLKPQFDKRGGLIPCVAQDIANGDILMLGYVNQDAIDKTIELKKATFWSTSRNELWTKGLTSGDVLELVEILIDCDQDAIIYKVKPLGSGACHTSNEHGKARRSCFYRAYDVSSDDQDHPTQEVILKILEP
jgi:phosphoribosyl-AMP cyclohydrolase